MTDRQEGDPDQVGHYLTGSRTAEAAVAGDGGVKGFLHFRAVESTAEDKFATCMNICRTEPCAAVMIQNRRTHHNGLNPIMIGAWVCREKSLGGIQ